MKKLAHFTIAFIFSVSAFSEVVDLVILQTTDIHANISYNNAAKGDGDWLRLMTLIEKERQLAGGSNKCLLLDCGDTIQGSLIGAFSRGEVSVLMLDMIQYDSWILGNHELDFGISRLKELTKMCKTPILSGNFRLSEFPPFPAYQCYEKSGVKIVVIGMNAFFLDSWVWGEKMEGFEVEKASISIEKIMPEVLNLTPDIIILGMHQGLMEQDKRKMNEVKTLAYRFPQIDLILGGHTHREFAGKKVGNTWYVQGGKHGEFLAKVVASIDIKKHRVLNIRSQLLASSRQPRNPIDSPAIQNWVKQARLFADKRICYIDREVSSSGTPGYDCHMSEIICRAISWATEAPIVFHGVLSNSSWSKDSYLTEEVLFDTIPYENGIGMALLTLNDLKEIINEQLKFKGTRSFNGIYGASVEINTIDHSVNRINFPHQPFLKGNERISVAFNSYAIAGAGKRFPVLRNILRRPLSRLVDLGLNTRDVVRRYLKDSVHWKGSPGFVV